MTIKKMKEAKKKKRKKEKNKPGLHQILSPRLSCDFLASLRTTSAFRTAARKLSSLGSATLGKCRLQGNSPSCTYDRSRRIVLEGHYLPEGL